MTNLDSIFKSRDITLPTKVRLVSSVQFSCSVMSDSLRPHESQHARPPCPSPCRDVRVGLSRKLSAEELMLLKCGVGEDT